MKRLSLMGVALAVLVAPPAHAQTSPAAPEGGAVHTGANPDPVEHTNRRLYAFGQLIDRVAFRPLAMCYRRWLPHPVRAGISNLIANLDEPGISVNDLLQGRFERASVAALRFGMNSTVGVAGLFDVAGHVGLQHHDNDAGITLARYGVGPGPYLYIPLAGPSTVRDAVGAGMDFFLDPLGWLNFKNADTVFDAEIVTDAVASRADADGDLRNLSRTAADPYATLRAYYLQSRSAEAHDQQIQIEDLPPIPDAAPPPTSAPPVADISTPAADTAPGSP